MKRSTPKTLFRSLAAAVFIMLIIGCEQEQTPPDTAANAQSKLISAENAEPGNAKRSRLIAVENAQLKKDIERLKQEHQKELEKQKQLLDKCLQEKKALEELSSKGVEGYMKEVLGSVVDENTKLRKENERLKLQVKNLQGQIDRLKAEIASAGR